MEQNFLGHHTGEGEGYSEKEDETTTSTLNENLKSTAHSRLGDAQGMCQMCLLYKSL